MAFYADNKIRVDSDGTVMEGTAAIRNVLSTFFGDNNYVLDEVTAPDIQASGDLADKNGSRYGQAIQVGNYLSFGI